MKTIPASYIPFSVRTGLSQILDPQRTLRDNDYRYFAERNGLTPQIVDWLDSQKTQFNTSSIVAVLKYLSERDGDRFTVYQVYKTLAQMRSDGQRIIIEGMPEIRSVYNGGTRPGQENSEPPTMNLPTQERSPSPPPPYDSSVSQHSVYMAGGDGAVGLNDLGCSPEDLPNRHPHGGQINGESNGINIAVPQPMNNGFHHPRPGACEGSFIPPSDLASSRSNRSENSVPSSNYSERLDHYGNVPAGRREAAENSSSFNGSEDGSMSPPSYEESQLHHRRTSRRSPTEMHELKLPLDGPQVNPGSPSGQQRQWNIRPAGAPRVCQEDGQRSLPPPSSRPVSYPECRPSSYQHQHEVRRPVSDVMFCSHSGACNCMEDWGPFSVLSALSAEGMPWNEDHHQTQRKQPLGSHQERNVVPQPHSVPRNHPNCSPRRQMSTPVMQTSAFQSCRNGLSSRFVFVVAADIDEPKRLDLQVKAFCQALEVYGMGYVVVRSTSQQPLVALPPSVIENLPPLSDDFKEVQRFVWSCYKRAAKVLMLVSPGYLRYADAYSEGARKPATLQQKLMRKIQEKLKEEFFNRAVAFRIWPVLLHEMKAGRVHLPQFLSDAVYYWFPLKQRAENVMMLLEEELCVRSSSDVKRSF